VNDYKCHCDEGYYEGENKEKGWEHDCLPEPCGTPAKVPHASTEKAGVLLVEMSINLQLFYTLFLAFGRFGSVFFFSIKKTSAVTLPFFLALLNRQQNQTN
jgi:hypothetical protein